VAKRYLALREELKVKEISAWMTTLDKLREQAAGVKLEYEQASRSLDAAKSGLEALYASSGSITERMHQKDVESEQTRERLSLAESAAAECDSAAAVLRANVQSSVESKERMQRDIAEQESRADEIRASLKEAGIELLDGPQGTTWRKI
jgi:chromosome segregation protein